MTIDTMPSANFILDYCIVGGISFCELKCYWYYHVYESAGMHYIDSEEKDIY